MPPLMNESTQTLKSVVSKQYLAWAALQKEVGGTDILWSKARDLLRFPLLPTPEGWSVWMSPNQTETVIVDTLYKCAVCPETLCPHAAAVMLYERLQEKPMSSEITKARFTTDDMMLYKGKEFIFYRALLREAQAQGLTTLDATWTYNDAGLSLATAVAVFADGRRHTEGGDATPENVGAFVKPHFRRQALTRAKARALRDALGVEECSIEELKELGDEDRPQATQSRVVPQMTSTAPTAATIKRAIASKLVVDTFPSGDVAFKVHSPDFPETYQRGKYPGIIIWDSGLKASGFDPDILDVDNPPDISGYGVEWEEYPDKKDPKITRARVNRLIPAGGAVASAGDDDDSDVPF